MLIKTAMIFLLGMALLAMIGRAIVRARGGKTVRPSIANLRPCPQCGRIDVAGAVLGRKKCGCKAK